MAKSEIWIIGVKGCPYSYFWGTNSPRRKNTWLQFYDRCNGKEKFTSFAEFKKLKMWAGYRAVKIEVREVKR